MRYNLNISTRRHTTGLETLGSFLHRRIASPYVLFRAIRLLHVFGFNGIRLSALSASGEPRECCYRRFSKSWRDLTVQLGQMSLAHHCRQRISPLSNNTFDSICPINETFESTLHGIDTLEWGAATRLVGFDFFNDWGGYDHSPELAPPIYWYKFWISKCFKDIEQSSSVSSHLLTAWWKEFKWRWLLMLSKAVIFWFKASIWPACVYPILLSLWQKQPLKNLKSFNDVDVYMSCKSYWIRFNVLTDLRFFSSESMPITKTQVVRWVAKQK